jgi:hypothetical protein
MFRKTARYAASKTIPSPIMRGYPPQCGVNPAVPNRADIRTISAEENAGKDIHCIAKDPTPS